MDGLQLSKDYFHGFQDLYEHKSLKKTGFGLIKVISYVFVLPPLFFGAIYAVTSLRDRVRKLDEMEKLALATPGPSEAPKKPEKQYSQEMIVERVTSSLKQAHKGKEMQGKVFTYWFRKLDAEGQRKVLRSMVDNKSLSTGLKHIPRDLKEFHVPDLENNKYRNRTKDVLTLIEFLGELKELEKLHIDLRSLGRLNLTILQCINDKGRASGLGGRDDFEGVDTAVSEKKWVGNSRDILAVVLSLAKIFPSLPSLKEAGVAVVYGVGDYTRVSSLGGDITQMEKLLYAHANVKKAVSDGIYLKNSFPLVDYYKEKKNVPQVKSVSYKRTDGYSDVSWILEK